MRKTAGTLLFFLGILSAHSQIHDPRIGGFIDRVDIDSLTSFVRILSGEDSVMVGDSLVLIQQRSDFSGKHLAAEYITEKFRGYGLEAYDQFFSGDGRNVYGVQNGSLYPGKEYIICAHYDAVTTYCADDNASGTAAVLEAARILSSETLNYTVIYALWDKEELGLIGSDAYAGRAEAFSEDIRGVINLDMIGWDGNGDGLSEIHSRTIANSMTLANLMMAIDSIYANPLNPVISVPGITNSDQGSFWNHGFGAVLLIEAIRGGDFNPYYHSSADRVEKFDTAYFMNMTKLALGTLSTLAAADGIVAVEDAGRGLPAGYRIDNYPNPFNSSTVIRYGLPVEGDTRITVYNSAGERAGVLFDGFQRAGAHEIGFDGGKLASGVYLLRLESTGGVKVNKMILMK